MIEHTQTQQVVPFHHHPVQLWIGNEQALIPHVEHVLQQQFCKHNGCTYCTECHKIRMHQHHAIMWVNPEKQYTRELIEPILHTIQFQLSPDMPFFFILQNADFLTDSCANALLKSLEEPPAGYRFLLLAARKQMVLPTIRSRCIVQLMDQTETSSTQQPLFDHFTQAKKLTATQFLQILDKSDINERESIELIDALLAHWRLQVHKAIQQEDTNSYILTTQTMHSLTKAAQQPPMPGSSKLFWKNLFLQLLGT